MQIPWGPRLHGGPLIVELSDVSLITSRRDETAWEEGPAARREQAAKQAQLAAAELSKLSSRLEADSAGAAAAAAQGAKRGLRWSIADYLTSFLLNRLQLSVRRVHVCFRAPTAAAAGEPGGEYASFGVQLASLATIQEAAAAGAAAAQQQLAAALADGGAPTGDPQALKIVRQLAVEGWALYWRPAGGAQAGATATPQEQQGQAQPSPLAGLADIPASDYIVTPVDAVMRIAVRDPQAAGADAAAAGGGALSVEILTCAADAAVQVSAQQLAGMVRLADDAAVWQARNRYGRYRPSGWVTQAEAAQHQRRSAAVAHAAQQPLQQRLSQRRRRPRLGQQQHAQPQQPNYVQQRRWRRQAQPAGVAVGASVRLPGQQPRRHRSRSSGSSPAGCRAVSHQASLEPGSSAAASAAAAAVTAPDEPEAVAGGPTTPAGSSTLVPTARQGLGAPVSWRQVWRYALNCVLDDLRRSKRLPAMPALGKDSHKCRWAKRKG